MQIKKDVYLEEQILVKKGNRMKKRLKTLAGHESMSRMLPAEKETKPWKLIAFGDMLSRGTRMLSR